MDSIRLPENVLQVEPDMDSTRLPEEIFQGEPEDADGLHQVQERIVYWIVVDVLYINILLILQDMDRGY